MKIRTQTHTNLKKIITIVAIAIIVIGGYVLAARYFQLWPFSHNHSINNQVQQEKQTGEDIKKQAQENQKNSSGSGSTPVPTPTPSQNGKSTVPVTITTANQSGDTLEVRTLIGAIATGTCTITLTGPGATYTATASVQNLPSSSTCEGFNVPTSKLTPGTWSLTINFENDSLQGSASQTITIQ